jgi:hypothetical protein
MDNYHDLYRLPSDNIVRNGGFETTLTPESWQIADTTMAHITDTVRHTQQRSLYLGPHCPTFCLEAATLAELPGLSSNKPLLLPDRIGNIHALIALEDTGLVYQRRTPTGVWKTEAMLAEGIHPLEVEAVSAIIDHNDQLHVAWEVYNHINLSAQIYYTRRSTDGEWLQPENVSPGRQPEITVDTQGNIHMLYACYNRECNQRSLLYRQRATDGGWSEPVLMQTFQDFFTSIHDIASLDDGVVHAVWPGSHQVRTGAGQWLVMAGFPFEASISELQLAVEGSWLHAVATASAGVYYSNWNAGNGWSAPEIVLSGALPLDFGYTFAATENPNQPGTLYLASDPTGFVPNHLQFRLRSADGIWSNVNVISSREPEGFPVPPTGFVVGYDGAIHTAWGVASERSYRSSQRATISNTTVVSQTLATPITMHQPTLTFMYQIEAGTTGASYFAVTVQDAVTQTQVFSATQVTPWRLGWVDMERWQGQTVTVTFGIYQSAGDAYLQAYLDEVSLGSWRTAVVQSLTPVQIEFGMATTLVITGENFIEVPTIRLGELTLEAVRQLDTHTLEVDLPSTPAPGVYTLWLVNPGSESASVAGSLAVGDQTYLPLIIR